MADSIMFTYYTLESKNTYEYHYYYFTGFESYRGSLWAEVKHFFVWVYRAKDQ